MRNRCSHWAELPTSSPGEHTALGKLAERDELASNALPTREGNRPYLSVEQRNGNEGGVESAPIGALAPHSAL